LSLIWIEKDALLVLHARSLALHGGGEGVRDEGLLEGALQRPQNLNYYEGVEDLAVLAATYAVAISENQPFIDGNKRAAFHCLTLFLRLNGKRLKADQAEAALTILSLAAGTLNDTTLANWIRAHTSDA
jgi:death-on-curing protein